MTTLSIFALGHETELLADVPRRDGLRPVDLRDLGLPPDLAGNQLSETRFFLSERALDVETDYVGVMSARHNTKYADRPYPALEELPDIRRGLAANRAFGPMVTAPDALLPISEAAHPGMSVLMREAAELIPGVDVARPTIFTNSFIVRRDVYVDFVTEFRRVFDVFHARYGFDFPFEYRCKACGSVSHDGFGRYRRDRHPAYFYERVTALYFARPQFEVFDLDRRRLLSTFQFARYLLGSARSQTRTYRF